MAKSTIQINTIKDRFNFVLHAGANLALLAGMVYADKSTLNLEVAVAGIGLPYVILPLLAHRKAALNFFTGKKAHRTKPTFKTKYDTSALPLSSVEALMSGDVARLQRVSNSIARKLGADPIEIRVLGSLSEDFAKPIRKKRKFKSFAEARDAAREDIEAAMLARLNENGAALGTNMATGKKIMGISRKLLRDLTHSEQEAIIGHELAHDAAKHASVQSIAHFAGKVAMTVAFLHAGNMLTDTGPAALPLAGPTLCYVWLAKKLLHSHYSRVLEFQADKLGARATSPQALISGLTKLEGLSEGQELKEHFWEKFPYLMYSHPSAPQRIRKLQRMLSPQKA